MRIGPAVVLVLGCGGYHWPSPPPNANPDDCGPRATLVSQPFCALLDPASMLPVAGCWSLDGAVFEGCTHQAAIFADPTKTIKVLCSEVCP